MKTRNSNLEMLRILCMLMIISHHYSVHGFASFGLTYGTNRHLVDILSMGGKLGVNIFVLISGYFVIKTEISIYKIISIIVQTWFYSIGILVLFLTVLSTEKTIEGIDIKKSIMPLSYQTYWFVTCYVILMILTPYINILVNNISKKMHCKLIVIFLCMWSVIPSIFRENLLMYSELGWFVLLYFIATYIRKYVDNDKINLKKHIGITILSGVLLVVSVVMLDCIGRTYMIEELSVMRRWYSSMNSVIVIVLSIELFLVFLAMKEKSNRFVNTIASATFGVYLIHDNFLLRPYIWDVIFKNKEMYSSQYLIVHAICTISIIFVVCLIIDLIRQLLVKLFIKFIRRLK
ncbi:MAG: acyltransferase [Lachnospiraceae bacterium]|nr:acyltransferase [Lachnospiraceae bacterium]